MAFWIRPTLISLVRERAVANLAPIDLQVLTGQALETNRYVFDRLLVLEHQPLPLYGRAAHRITPAKWLFGVLTRFMLLALPLPPTRPAAE